MARSVIPSSASSAHASPVRRLHPATSLVAAVALFAAMAGLAPLVTTPVAVTSIPGSFFTVTDQQGANDVPSQSDLTQMGRDEFSSAGYYKLFWSWDSTDQWTGTGQTGDACALFDYDGDGNIDAAVCGQVTNLASNPAQVVLNHAPYVFRCDDSRNDRCSQPTSALPYNVGVAEEIAAGPIGATAYLEASDGQQDDDLVTPTDPFDSQAANGPGSNHPDDASLQVDISKAYLNGLATNKGRKWPAIASPAPNLVNVCSYPSAGNGGNNNPFDCVVAPGSGFLKIVKNAAASQSWTFGLKNTPTSTSQTVTVTTTGTTGASGNIGLEIGTAKSITESATTGWTLSSASCSISTTTPTATGTWTSFAVSGYVISGIEVRSGLLTTCTFSNIRDTGSILVQKTDGTSALAGAAFSATLTGESAVSIPSVAGSTGLFCLDGLPTGGTYAISETTTPDGYTGATNIPSVTVSTTSTCAARVAASSTPDRTVTNNAAPGTINISKTDDRPLALPDAGFTLYKDTNEDGSWQTSETTAEGSAQRTSSTGAASFSNVPLGRYCVVETTTPAGHTTAAAQCVTVGLGTSVGTGQTINLSFTNPRTHKVIVIVCHEGTNTLAPSGVTLGSGTGSATTSLGTAGLPSGLTEATLCGLGGAAYPSLTHSTVAPSVSIAAH